MIKKWENDKKENKKRKLSIGEVINHLTSFFLFFISSSINFSHRALSINS